MQTSQHQAQSDRAVVSNEAAKSNSAAASLQGSAAYSAILVMQQKIGNQATAKLLQRRQAAQNQPPIQRMKDAEFQQAFGVAMNINKKLTLLGEVMKFKKWLKGTIRDKTNLSVDEYMDQKEFTAETLEGYIAQYKAFRDLVGPEVASNKKADVPVPQGMFLVASQSELEAGMYTDGVSPCVAVGFQIQTEEEDDVLALGHFDSFTSPSLLITMYKAALQKTGKNIEQVSNVTISLAGGISSPQHEDSSELSGPELFKQLAEIADALKADASDKIQVIKRPSIDDMDVNVRLDSNKGMERYKKSLVNPAMSDQLKQNPQALKATKFLLENGQHLTNDKGVLDQFGVENRNKLQNSVKAAEEESEN